MESVDSVGTTPLAELLENPAARRVRLCLQTIDRPERAEGHVLRLGAVARSLTESGVGALETSRALAALNDILTTRLLHLAEMALGPPPCPYAWLALGSEGRMEPALLTDQDNALAYAEGGTETDAYFGRLAEHVISGLLFAGFPPCPGGYMATNWRRSLRGWQETCRGWLDNPNPQRVLEAEVFLDFRRVHGELGLDPFEAMLRRMADRPGFLAQMARSAVVFEPPLRFGRVRSRDHNVDIKRGGLTAIVLLARLYGLVARAGARSTPERLAAAAQAGAISDRNATRLTESFRVLADLRLRAQLRDVAAGKAPDNLVSLDQLTPGERDQLRNAFRTIRERQRATALEFHTETVL